MQNFKICIHSNLDPEQLQDLIDRSIFANREPDQYIDVDLAVAGEPLVLRNGLVAYIDRALEQPDVRGVQYFGVVEGYHNGEFIFKQIAWNENFEQYAGDHNYDIIRNLDEDPEDEFVEELAEPDEAEIFGAAIAHPQSLLEFYKALNEILDGKR